MSTSIRATAAGERLENSAGSREQALVVSIALSVLCVLGAGVAALLVLLARAGGDPVAWWLSAFFTRWTLLMAITAAATWFRWREKALDACWRQRILVAESAEGPLPDLTARIGLWMLLSSTLYVLSAAGFAWLIGDSTAAVASSLMTGGMALGASSLLPILTLVLGLAVIGWSIITSAAELRNVWRGVALLRRRRRGEGERTRGLAATSVPQTAAITHAWSAARLRYATGAGAGILALGTASAVAVGLPAGAVLFGGITFPASLLLVSRLWRRRRFVRG